ncbi:formate dehydrogenase accessory sulfurtransferase FdhD [Methanophagales archaeon]|nr:MAG: formate dehydrogenase accessory sulfurtransferase FdhD [Methanophagales archaeon]
MDPKKREGALAPVKIREVSEDKCLQRHRDDFVVREAEVRIEVGREPHSQLFCLPSHFEELAIGHLNSEGLDTSYVANLDVEEAKPGKYVIRVTLEREVHRNPLKVNSRIKIRCEDVFKRVKELGEEGVLYKATGGTHVVAAFDQNGAGIFIEDISRHCAIDKLIGTCIKNGIEISENILVTSSRQTHTTMEKVLFADLPVVISVSAPTERAIRDATEFGITLVGFARDKRFNVYTNGWRIL